MTDDMRHATARNRGLLIRSRIGAQQHPAMASDLFLAFTLAPTQWQNRLDATLPRCAATFIASAVLRESALADNDMKDDFTADNLSPTD